MMQNGQKEVFTAATLPHMAGIYSFIASFSSNIKEIWVIDSGATDHICISITLMHDIHILTHPILVQLPNGQTIKVTTVGSVRLTPTLTLINVFHIPTFTYNLISISKLTNSSHSAITFTHRECIFRAMMVLSPLVKSLDVSML